ncbi:MAG: hypothetical protein MUC79_15645, partial [Thiobacillaceae bacterium]|nr:hypothetical protein [Thiobacillaceae bacterium]
TAWILAQAVTFLPEVPLAAAPSARDLERGRRVYRQLVPEGVNAGGRRELTLTARDLELGLGYLLGRTLPVGVRAVLGAGDVSLRLSLALPAPLSRRYLNAGLGFTPTGQGVTLARVELGDVRVPLWIARPLGRALLERTAYAAHLAAAEGLLKSVDVEAGRLRLVLDWSDPNAQAALAAARLQLAGVRPDQMAAYRDRLAELAVTRPRPGFPTLLGELLVLARERSAQEDPVAENRALLIVLAEALNGVRLGLPGRGQPRLWGLTLAGRGDFVQHFTLSAALAAIAGEDLADRAGLFKEVRDTQGGSGFSFNDLAIDRAGARFGRLATASPESARRVQRKLAGTADEALFIPPIRDLPEFIPPGVFARQYGGVGGVGYRRLLAEIERRIAALPLYRDEGGD